jgi:ribosome biogenesis GTPase
MNVESVSSGNGMTGRIIRAISGFWYVETEAGVLRCRARGRFRLDKLTPLVGDLADGVTDLGGGEGALDAILPRRNAFVRPAVANVELMVIIASAAVPVTDPFLIDRMAAVAELKGCEPSYASTSAT